jgi:DNA-binding CsgD family transcriptional regulator
VAKAGLTPREARVLELLAADLTADAIGHTCRISPRTVRKPGQGAGEQRDDAEA